MTHWIFRPGRVRKESLTLYLSQPSLSANRYLETIFNNFIKKCSKQETEFYNIIESFNLLQKTIAKGGDSKEKNHLVISAYYRKRGSK